MLVDISKGYNVSDQSYSQVFDTNASPEKVFDKIGQVSEWWAQNYSGNSKSVGDVFTVKFKAGDSFTIKVTENLPAKRIVWDVVDAYQGWVKEPKEWVGTKIVWDIVALENMTEVRLTHEGLVPELECYGTCQAAWEYLMQRSLAQLLNTGKGLPA